MPRPPRSLIGSPAAARSSKCQILEKIGAEGQREQHASVRMKKSIQRLKKALQKELAVLDREIDNAVRGSPLWRHNEELMVSVPGVGPQISRSLMPPEPITGLPELGTLDRRQLAALVGYAPFTKRSGRWQGKEAIAGGRTIPRAALFMGAVVAVRYKIRSSKPSTSVSSLPGKIMSPDVV